MIHPNRVGWPNFVPDRIDGVFLIPGLSLSFVTSYSNQLLRLWAARLKSPMRKLEKRAPVRSRADTNIGRQTRAQSGTA
jgi:hypothetical protein